MNIFTGEDIDIGDELQENCEPKLQENVVKINERNKEFWEEHKGETIYFSEPIEFNFQSYPPHQTDTSVLKQNKKDICMSCGQEWKSEIWGAHCDCGKSNCVHYVKCSGCENWLGVTIGDDYCDVDQIYCPDCIKKAQEKRGLNEKSI